jgi:predicted transcriptional regulator
MSYSNQQRNDNPMSQDPSTSSNINQQQNEGENNMGENYPKRIKKETFEELLARIKKERNIKDCEELNELNEQIKKEEPIEKKSEKPNNPPENNPNDQSYNIFGFKEEVFMRTSRAGKYTPTVDEIRDTILDNKLTLNEIRILLYIQKNTVSFRKTHFKTTRQKIQEALNIVQPKISIAIRNLLKNGYILEVKDKSDYGSYYYALHPQTFNGVIVLRSVHEVPYKINRESKGYTKKVYGDYTKKVSGLYQKGNDFIPKRYKEITGITEITDTYKLLQYILLQYILLHSISDARVVDLKLMTEEVRNPIKTMKNMMWLLINNTSYVKYIVQQIFEINEHKTGFNKRPLMTHAMDYVCANWEKRLKPHYQIYDNKIEESEEIKKSKEEIKNLFLEFIELTEPMAKVFEFKKKAVSE